MISVIMLSCKRLHYLRRTLDAIRAHFQQLETDIQPQWICFDNGSAHEQRQELEALGFDALILSRENLGIGPAMNRLAASVRTPYLLNLQDDWLLENPNGIRFVWEAVRIFEADKKLAQIKLDTCHFLDFDDRKTYDGPFTAPQGNVRYFVQNPNMLWGGFTFPPAITRTSALHELGPFREDQPFRRGWAESEYSARFATRYNAIKSPDMLLFRHIGDEASEGWGGEKAGVAPITSARVETAPSGNGGKPIDAMRVESDSVPAIVSRPPKNSVACLLTAYRRPQNLKLQLEAVLNQTIGPCRIALWHNFHPDTPIDEDILRAIPHVRSSNANWGVWPRFEFCRELDAEYVCVFDDDTVPGPKWLENCLDTIRTHEGLLGANGVIFPKGTRDQQIKVGWIAPNPEAVEVDIVGHAWFFKREWLRCFGLEPRRGTATCGEDYHFSVALQKHLSLGTYVPPHDPRDKSGWGSVNGDLGKDKVALYLQPGEDKKKQDAHTAYLAAGWKPLALRKPGNGSAPATVLVSQAHEGNGNSPRHTNTSISRMRFTQDFRKDFEQFKLDGEPFAFARFADGELAFCMGQAIHGADGWRHDGRDTDLSRKLREAVRADMPGFYLGISCRCCDPKGHEWYARNIRAPRERVTFSNIFVNANYERFRQQDLSRTVLVSSVGGDFKVPQNAIEIDFDYSRLLAELHKVDRPILVAAGPLGKALIFDYWKSTSNRQVVVDIGSTLDPVIHGRPTRSYHHAASPTAKKVCVW